MSITQRNNKRKNWVEEKENFRAIDYLVESTIEPVPSTS